MEPPPRTKVTTMHEPTRYITASEAATLDLEQAQQTPTIDPDQVRNEDIEVDENVYEYMRHLKGNLGTGIRVTHDHFEDDPAVVYDPDWPGRCEVCMEPKRDCDHIWDPDRKGPWRHKQLGSQVPAEYNGVEVERAAAQYHLAFPETVD